MEASGSFNILYVKTIVISSSSSGSSINVKVIDHNVVSFQVHPGHQTLDPAVPP